MILSKNFLETYLEKEEFYSLIDGKERSSPNKTPSILSSPSDEKFRKKILFVGAKETEEAVSVAHNRLESWHSVPAAQKAAKLREVARLLESNGNLLADVMALEMGKCVKEGMGEVKYTAGFFTWYAGECERVYGKIIPSSHAGKNLQVIYEPVGVSGIITPWNFPLAMPARKIAAALAAGCTVVAKPSPETPISMLLLAKICYEAGIPEGALNIVIGPEKEIGSILSSDFRVRKISFTGSTEVGKILYAGSASTMKKLTLELGGHAPLIVFDDADLEVAVRETIAAKFRNNGQTCISANKILVQADIYDSFMEKFIEKVKMLKIGNPFDPTTDIGNVLHPQSAARVRDHLEDALAKGADPVYITENIFEPKILTEITPGMRIFCEETFGPIAPITKFTHDREALLLANSGDYGLASYVFTQNIHRIRNAISHLHYGIIGINEGVPSCPQASFGGLRNSGLGREGGPSGIYEYLSEKYICMAF